MRALRRHRLVLSALVLLLTVSLGALRPALAQSKPEAVVSAAEAVLRAFLDGPRAESIAPYVRSAYGVLIVPEMLGGAFLLSAEYGMGILLSRDLETGAWRGPAFYDVYAGGVGLQMGGQSTDLLVTVMNPAAVDRLVTTRLRFGADAGMAVGKVGGGVGAATTPNLGEDMYVFGQSRGLFGGVSLEGSFLVPRPDWTSVLFRREVENVPVLRGEVEPPAAASGLKAALEAF